MNINISYWEKFLNETVLSSFGERASLLREILLGISKETTEREVQELEKELREFKLSYLLRKIHLQISYLLSTRLAYKIDLAGVMQELDELDKQEFEVLGGQFELSDSLMNTVVSLFDALEQKYRPAIFKRVDGNLRALLREVGKMDKEERQRFVLYVYQLQKHLGREYLLSTNILKLSATNWEDIISKPLLDLTKLDEFSVGLQSRIQHRLENIELGRRKHSRK